MNSALIKPVSTTQIVFGTDYPYRNAAEHVKGLGEVFGPGNLRLIDRENTLRILPCQRAA